MNIAYVYEDDPLFERKIENAAAGLKPACKKNLKRVSKTNAVIIADYIISMQTEINPSNDYKKAIIILLCKFSQFHKDKTFNHITRQNIISFLDRLRNPETVDPLHKWIGTYNLYGIYLLRFFKWLYYSDVEPNKRAKPPVVDNIPQLKRKEQSIYKPSDLWSQEDDLLFLKYCPSKRMKCYHATSRDTGCRPHELLRLRIKDVIFKNAGDKQYAEVLLTGKTGSRHIPLIDSLPYIKDYLDHEHPQPTNFDASLFAGKRKSLGRQISVISLYAIYDSYKKNLFPKLLKDSDSVPLKDKERISKLLRKPWNPYIRRHSGWSPRSQMHLKYLHYFGNESSDSILEAYGIITKDKAHSDSLRSKQCPNCNESNKPDSKFCAKCRMVLTYDAYSETAEEYMQKENELQSVKKRMMNIENLLVAIQPVLQKLKPEVLDKLQVVSKE